MSRSTDWTPTLWLDTFDELLYDDNELDYGDSWKFNFNYSQTDEVNKEERKRGWKVYSPCAFASFQCGACSRSWSSARVVLLFRYRLRGGNGTVIMRPFGQACRQCEDDEFELPGFTKKEVEESLQRLFSKIRKNCYNEDESDGCPATPRKGHSKPHESDLCEGCRLGICCQDDDDDDDDDDVCGCD